jgi:glutathione synthase/RimK-type ligase-like ATP-grasp enzyme
MKIVSKNKMKNTKVIDYYYYYSKTKTLVISSPKDITNCNNKLISTTVV